MKKILIVFLLITAAWSGCKKNQEEDEGEINSQAVSISKVEFSSEFAGQTPGGATGFSFSVVVPVEGYAKLSLKRLDVTGAVDSIISPTTGTYKLTDKTLEYSKRFPMGNYFVWSKDDGTTISQQVLY